MIPADGWTLLQAPPKTGKSMMAAQIAHALSLGIPFLNWKPAHPWRVVYIQADAPPVDWHEQLKQLGFLHSPALTIDRATVGLCCLDNLILRTKLKHTLLAVDAQLVIFDALEKLTRLDLNEKEGCQKLLEQVEMVFKGPRVLIHHPRKLKEGGAWTSVDEVAGNHYLAGDASSIITLKKNGPHGGYMKVVGRLMDSTWSLTRDAQDYRWTAAVPLGHDGAVLPGTGSPGDDGLPPGLYGQPAP